MNLLLIKSVQTKVWRKWKSKKRRPEEFRAHQSGEDEFCTLKNSELLEKSIESPFNKVSPNKSIKKIKIKEDKKDWMLEIYLS